VNVSSHQCKLPLHASPQTPSRTSMCQLEKAQASFAARDEVDDEQRVSSAFLNIKSAYPPMLKFSLPFTIMLNLLDPRRFIRNSIHLIPPHRIVRPRAVPQSTTISTRLNLTSSNGGLLIYNIHILLRNLIPLIMALQIPTKRIRGSLRPARHHIPRNPSIGQVIQSTERAR
jgi:hypothetical protein